MKEIDAQVELFHIFANGTKSMMVDLFGLKISIPYGLYVCMDVKLM